MTQDRLVEEIRRAQRAIRRNESDRSPGTTAVGNAVAPPLAAPPPARDPRASLRHLIGELASRLDRTQEQLLARLGDLNHDAPPLATSSLESQLDERLSALETRLATLGAGLAGASAGTAELGAKLAALESAVREEGRRSASSEELAALAARIETQPRSSGADAPAGHAPPPGEPALSALEKRLESIEERLGGDAGSATLGAAIARLGERLDRLAETLSAAGGDSAPVEASALGERVDRILEAILEQRGGSEEAKKSVATLKRDFSLLVHTINGHLQESRNRSDLIESKLEEMRTALVPIARHVGLPTDGA